MSDEVADIIKGSDTKISLTLHRGIEGLRVSIKTISQIEDFFQRLSGGQSQQASIYNRMWTRDKGDETPLNVYMFEKATIKPPVEEDEERRVPYTLELVGSPLLSYVENRRTGAKDTGANISFLRIVGISEGAGATFNIKGVYSSGEVKNIRNKLSEALRRFYIDYMQPVSLSVMISTQDMRL
jgi:hypothetical protein